MRTTFLSPPSCANLAERFEFLVLPGKKTPKVLPQILQPQKHVGAEFLQVVAVQIQAPEAGQAGEGPLLEVRDAVAAQVKQVQAGEIPKVCAVDPLD